MKKKKSFLSFFLEGGGWGGGGGGGSDGLFCCVAADMWRQEVSQRNKSNWVPVSVMTHCVRSCQNLSFS